MRVRSLQRESVRRLAAVMSEQVAEWRSQLFWDYQPTLTMIRGFMRSGMLPGCVLETEDGDTVGYSYFVLDGAVAFIGELFIREECAAARHYDLLLDATLEAVQAARPVLRTECQVFSLNCDLAPLFRRRAFETVPRLYLSVDLRSDSARGPFPLDRQFVSRPWRSEFLLPASRVIADSYVASVEGRVCHDYRSPQGCLRYVRALVETPSCGIFNAGDTRCVFDSKGGMQAVLLASDIDRATGMIPQISVRRAVQRRGIGSHLLGNYLAELRRRGYRRATLSVSEANQTAHALYQALGFQTHQAFFAYVREAGA